MDLKVLKQDLAYENTACKQTAEQSIDLDVALPDYMPRISRLLKCKATPKIASNGINGQTLLAEGNISILIFYATADEEICSYEYNLPLSKSFEVGDNCSDGIAVCMAREEYLNSRLVDENKVELHGAVGITAKIINRKVTPVVADVDGCGVVVNRGVAPATSPVGLCEKFLNIEEELQLGNGQPSIRNILRYEACAGNTECKIISDKVVVKGDIKVFVLYCGEQTAAPQVLRCSVPYSQIIDIDGINDTCECESSVDIVRLEVKPHTSMSGETRSVSFAAKVKFLVTATCNNDVAVVYDAFSTKYETEIVTDAVSFNKIFATVNERFVTKNSIDAGGNSIGTIIDLWCDPHVVSNRIFGEEAVISGNMLICVLAYDLESRPCYFERNVDFEYKHPIKNTTDNMQCSAAVSPVAVTYTILNADKLEVTAELLVNCTINNCVKIPVLTDLRVNEDNLKQSASGSAMIVYFADSGEQIWDIARRYNSSPDEIAQINSLEGNTVNTAAPLIIPVK